MKNEPRRHGATEPRRLAGRCFCLLTGVLVLGAAGGLSASASEKSKDVSASPAGMAFRVAKVVALDDADTVINDAIVLVKEGEI